MTARVIISNSDQLIEGTVNKFYTSAAEAMVMKKAANLSDVADTATARTNLGVDPAGTDNSTPVTLAVGLDYLTLIGQEITLNAIDLTTDVTGTLPVLNGGTGLSSITSGHILYASGANTIASAAPGVTSGVQPYDANTALYDDTTANFTGTLQNGGSNVLVDTDISSAVQAWDANLDQIAALAATTDNFILGSTGSWIQATPAQVRTALGLDAGGAGDIWVEKAGDIMTGDLAMGANNITLTGSIATTGARATKGWFTDLEITNFPTVGGTAIDLTFVNASGDDMTGNLDFGDNIAARFGTDDDASILFDGSDLVITPNLVTAGDGVKIPAHVAMGADGVVDAKSILYIEESIDPAGADVAGMEFLCKHDSPTIGSQTSGIHLKVNSDQLGLLNRIIGMQLDVTHGTTGGASAEMEGLKISPFSLATVSDNISNWKSINLAGAVGFSATGGKPLQSTGLVVSSHGSTGITTAIGVQVSKQQNATNNYGIVLLGDDAGADIVFGASKDASIYWDGGANELVIDPTLQTGTQTRLVGNVTIDEYLYHDNDPDTYLRFSSANTLALVAGNSVNCTAKTTEFTVNPNGANLDFIVEGDTDTDLIHADASTDRVGISVAAPSSTFHVDGSLAHKVTTVISSPHTAGNEVVILCDDDTAAGAITVDLPTTAGISGRIYHIKKLGTTGNITVDGNGSQTIDGATTAVLTSQYESIQIVSDGTNWSII